MTDDATVFLTDWCMRHPGSEYAMRMVPHAGGLLGYEFKMGIMLPPKAGQEDKDRKICSVQRTVSPAEFVTVRDPAEFIRYIWREMAKELLVRVEQLLRTV